MPDPQADQIAEALAYVDDLVRAAKRVRRDANVVVQMAARTRQRLERLQTQEVTRHHDSDTD